AGTAAAELGGDPTTGDGNAGKATPGALPGLLCGAAGNGSAPDGARGGGVWAGCEVGDPAPDATACTSVPCGGDRAGRSEPASGLASESSNEVGAKGPAAPVETASGANGSGPNSPGPGSPPRLPAAFRSSSASRRSSVRRRFVGRGAAGRNRRENFAVMVQTS